jgi:hypothetical protein
MTIALILILIAVNLVLVAVVHDMRRTLAGVWTYATDINDLATQLLRLAESQAEREQQRDELRKTLFTGEGRSALRQRLRERQETAAKV